MKRTKYSGAAASKKSIKSSNGKRSNVLQLVRAKPKLNLFSSMLPHHFRRSLSDAVVYCSGAGAITCVDPTGAAPGWAGFTGLTQDYGGVAAVSQFGFSVIPGLNLLPSYQEFTNLFERYQITKMTVKITPLMGDSYNPGTGSAIPSMTSVIDFTDATPPATQAEVDQYENQQSFLLDTTTNFSRSCRPKPAQSMYVSAVNTGYASAGGPADLWLDTTGATNATPHYGMKFWVRNFFTGGAGGGVAFRISPCLELSFREAH